MVRSKRLKGSKHNRLVISQRWCWCRRGKAWEMGLIEWGGVGVGGMTGHSVYKLFNFSRDDTKACLVGGVGVGVKQMSETNGH